MVSHRAQKRDEKWQRWKRDQKEEERRLKDEHEKLIKHYQEKKEKLMAVVAKRDESIKKNADLVNKRIEDIHMKREMQELHDQDGLEMLVREIEDKSTPSFITIYSRQKRREYEAAAGGAYHPCP